MYKRIKRFFIVSSFEDASILRKFTILFILSSILPLSLLFYVYTMKRNHTPVALTSQYFTYVMILATLGVFIGYKSIRDLFVNVINITKENRKSLEKLLGTDTLQELDQQENEITVLSHSFSAVTHKLEENIKSLENAKKTLQSVMTKVSKGISNMEKIDTFLDLILETMTNALSCKVAALMTLNDPKTELNIRAVYGISYDNQNTNSIKLTVGSPLAKVLETKKPVILSGVFLKNDASAKLNELFGESVLCVPLLFRDKAKGILTLTRVENLPVFNEDDIRLTRNLASQIAVALENSKLNKDIEKTYFETISALALAVDAKDQYSRGHLDRVAEHVSMIGKHLGLDEGDLNTLRDAARLHDLGKIGIPDNILRKEGSLTDDEWIIMRRHTEIGESIIKPIRSLAHLCDLIRHHHEKLDGTGYPDGLKAEDISPLVRILTVADIYDALTSERSYRPKKSTKEAFGIMRSMDKALDQDIVGIFFECLGNQD